MPALTRRSDHNRPQECWRVYYGDVHAGTIAQCVGNPGAAPKWQWRCGFYPGSMPGECTAGTAATFERRARLSKLHGASSSRSGKKPGGSGQLLHQRVSSGGTSSYSVPPGFSGVDPTGNPPMTSTIIFSGLAAVLCSTVDSRG
jgi:hypothetical protein